MGNGCFVGSTLIDGGKIKDVNVGFYVMSFNHESLKLEVSQVTHVFKKPMPQKLIKINDKIVCTFDHLFYEMEHDCYIPAHYLKLGDRLFSRILSVEIVTKLEQITPRGENKYVYNLEVKGLNNYFANGLLVHSGCI